MHKIVIFGTSIIVGLYVLIEGRIVDGLLTFLLSGTIPGTSLNLSPSLMLAILTATAWLLLFRITTHGAANHVTVRRLVKRYTQRQKRMPKRRFALIPTNLDR